MTPAPQPDPGWWVIRHPGGAWTAYRDLDRANVSSIRLQVGAPKHYAQLPHG